MFIFDFSFGEFDTKLLNSQSVALCYVTLYFFVKTLHFFIESDTNTLVVTFFARSDTKFYNVSDDIYEHFDEP